MRQTRNITRLAVVAVGLLMVAILVVGACSKPAPSPTAKPSPAAPASSPSVKPSSATPASSPAAKPPPAAPAPSPTAKPQRATVKIDILGGSVGSAGYVSVYALSELLNKHSSWVRANAVETASVAERFRTIQEVVEKRSTTLAYAAYLSALQASRGQPPYKVARPVQVVAVAEQFSGNWVTYDSKIKTAQDLIGKTVISLTKGASLQVATDALLQHWGVLDKVRRVYGEHGKAATSLIDGTAQVANFGASGASASRMAPNPAGEEMLVTKRLYFLPVTKSDMEGAAKITNWPMPYFNLPAGTMHPKQVEDAPGYLFQNCWFADASMDSEITYEVARVLYEYRAELESYYASFKGVEPKDFTAVPASEAEFHPGAAKFWKEKGIKIGL